MSKARTTPSKSFCVSTMPPDSIAISVPDPIAIPTSAIERAGASLIPSPTKATLLASCSFWMALAFSWGRTSAMTVSIPTCLAIAWATRSLSPVNMTVFKPRSLSFLIASFELAFGASWMAIKPITCPSTDKLITVLACSCNSTIRFSSSGSIAVPSWSLPFPKVTNCWSIWPWTPFPSIAWKFSTGDNTKPFSSAWDNTAWASGCSEKVSRLAASVKTRASSPTTSVTSGWPMVMVPVLSNTTVWIFCTSWRTVPFLIRTPILALRPVPTIRAVGVAKPRAQGQAIMRTETA